MEGQSVAIAVQRVHLCSEECAYTHLLQFRAGPNPKFDKTTGKCDQSGQVQECPPSIADWPSAKAGYNLSNADDIVIEGSDGFHITFSYPLKESHTFPYQPDRPEGATREYVIDCICNKYHEIYKEENAASPPSTFEERMKRGGLMNRERTTGPYGIWGHDLGDLYLEGINYVSSLRTITLDIGS